MPPGSTHTYIWGVPPSAGPGPADPSTVVWMYHSHTDETMDTNAGLVGAIVVGRAGALGGGERLDAHPAGVDRCGGA